MSKSQCQMLHEMKGAFGGESLWMISQQNAIRVHRFRPDESSKVRGKVMFSGVSVLLFMVEGGPWATWPSPPPKRVTLPLPTQPGNPTPTGTGWPYPLPLPPKDQTKRTSGRTGRKADLSLCPAPPLNRITHTTITFPRTTYVLGKNITRFLFMIRDVLHFASKR